MRDNFALLVRILMLQEPLFDLLPGMWWISIVVRSNSIDSSDMRIVRVCVSSEDDLLKSFLIVEGVVANGTNM